MEKKTPYQTRLDGDYWGQVKQAMWREGNSWPTGPCCERCGVLAADDLLDIHHKTYRNVGRELEHLDDLMFLCRPCHKYIHGRAGYDPLNPLKSFDAEVRQFLGG